MLYPYTHGLVSVPVPVPMTLSHVVPVYPWSRIRTRTRTHDFVTYCTRIPMVSYSYPYPLLCHMLYPYTHGLVFVPVPVTLSHVVPVYPWSRIRTRTPTHDFVTCCTRISMVSYSYPYPYP